METGKHSPSDVIDDVLDWSAKMADKVGTAVNEMLENNGFEQRVLDVLEKHGIRPSNETFTVDEIVSAVDSLETGNPHTPVGYLVDKRKIKEALLKLKKP